MKLIPVGPRLLVKEDEKKERTLGGIVLPDTKQDAPMSGTVVAVGEKCEYDFKIGQRVFFRIYTPDKVESDGEKFLICEESDILAIYNGE